MSDIFDRYGYAIAKRVPTEPDLIIEDPEWFNDTEETVWLDEDEWETVDEFYILEELDAED